MNLQPGSQTRDRVTAKRGASRIEAARLPFIMVESLTSKAAAASRAAPLPPAISKPTVTIGFADRAPKAGERFVASEVPVQVSFAGIPFGIMMMTPADLDDFAYGFSLTEGVIDHHSDIRAVETEPVAGGLRLAIDLIPRRLQAHLARKRAMAGRTSCGLCGIEDFEALPRASSPEGDAPTVALAALERALTEMETLQRLNAVTRAVHGAAWADAEGRIIALREDVGRHNALDKLLGAALRQDIAPQSGFVVVTSRASYEMVEKTATFGCRTLVAVSAPTALAIERAIGLDVTLIGIARRDAVTIFHGAKRVRV